VITVYGLLSFETRISFKLVLIISTGQGF